MIIRKATEADQPELERLEQLCFKEFWGSDELEADRNLNPFSRWLIMEEDDEENSQSKEVEKAADAAQPSERAKSKHAAGYAIVWCTFEQAQIARIGIDPALQKRGLGSKLMDAIKASAREEGCEFLSLEVRVSNAPAIALYKKAGLVELNRKKRYYSNGEDALFLGCGL